MTTEVRGAQISGCGKYRFNLWRVWDDTKPLVMFIGLNPSTADSVKDDPTIRRVKAFAKSWGYGGVYMLNLFPLRTPYPRDLLVWINESDSIVDIRTNDQALKFTAQSCDRIIFAWGSFKEAKERADVVTTMFNGYALKINNDGSPKHPLYVRADTEPIPYN